MWNSLQVMMVIYLACAVLITPWAHPLQVLELNALQGWLLFACCLNTLVAYGAFAEALAHWEASRVSAALALASSVSAAISASLALPRRTTDRSESERMAAPARKRAPGWSGRRDR